MAFRKFVGTHRNILGWIFRIGIVVGVFTLILLMIFNGVYVDSVVHPDANRARLADVVEQEYGVSAVSVGESYHWTNAVWCDSLYFAYDNDNYKIIGHFWGNGDNEWSYKVVKL